MLMRLSIAALALAFAGEAAAQVNVRGYTRSDGTYVAPHTRSSPNSSTYDNYGSTRSPTPTYRPQPLYTAPPASAPACTGYGCYAQPSTANGRPRTSQTNGYIRRDGTYVQPYFRSPQ